MSRFQTSSTTKLMPSKKLLAVFLSATLVLSGISTSAYGAASETAEEKVLPDNPELVLDANETDAYHVVANDEFDTTALAAEPQKLDTPTSEIETPSATPEFESDVDVIADVSNPAFEGYSSVDSVLVKVTAAEGVLPEGTTVNATSVNRDDVIEAVAQRINEQGEQLQDATAIDVTLRDKDGNDIQPDGEVNVCFFNTNVTGDEIGIFRVSDDASLVETVKARQTDTTMQSFDVDHFTIYVVGGSVINSNADGGANSISNPYRMLTNSTMLLTSSPWKTPSSSWSIVEGDAYIDLTQESPDSARIASADEAGTAVVCYEYPSGATTKTEYFYITVENASKVTVSYGMNKINFNDGTTQGTYDVTGTVPASQEVMAGETITLPEPDLLTCSNGVFVGWSTYYNANAASAPSYTNVVYPAGAEYTVPQSNVKLHAIWARTNVNAQFYIYSAEGVPTEPQSHPDAAYYGPIVIENALETAAFYTDSTKGVDDRLLNKPSDEEITQALSAKHKTYDPTTQYVLWYVIKNEGNWHVDGVLLNKSLVRLSYDANAPAGSWSNMPDGQQYASGDTAQVSSKTPSRNGYTFTGWNTEKKGTGTFYESNENFTITGDTTLYAQWIPEGNTVYHVQRYDVNSQLLIDDSSRFAPTKSSVWATEADKTIEGYNYEGDNYSDSSSTTIINGLVAPDGSLVLKLYFSKRSDLSYTVNYLEEGTNRVLHAPKPVDSNVFGSYVTETALPLNGYHVVGDSEITLSIAADVSRNVITFYYAADYHAPDPSVLYYDGNAATSGTTAPTKGLANNEVTVAANGFSKDGYMFTGWNTKVDGTGDTYNPADPYTLVPGGSTLYAQWTASFSSLSLEGFEVPYDGDAHRVQLTGNLLPTDTVEYWAQGTKLETNSFINVAESTEVTAVVTRGNETWKSEPVQAKINPLPLTIRANDNGKVAGEPEPNLTATVVGMLGSEKFDGSFTVYREPGETAGEYPISITDLIFNNENYTVSFVPGVFTITAPIPVAPTPTTPDATITEQTPTPLPTLDTLTQNDPLTPVVADLPGVAETAIEPAQTPVAGPNEQAIADNETPLASYDKAVCWVHYWIILGIIITMLYSAGVLARRITFTRKLKKFEDKILGIEDEASSATVPAATLVAALGKEA